LDLPTLKGQIMDWNNLIGPAVVAAIVSGLVAVVGFVVNRNTLFQLHRERLKAEGELADKKFLFDKKLAYERFTYERQQAVFKRRFELAEHILADTYRLRELISFARNSASSGNDGSTRPQSDMEPDKLTQVRNHYFVPIERLHKENGFTPSFFARRNSCRAHFGSEIDVAFKKLEEAIISVKISAETLIHQAGDFQNTSKEDFNKLKNDIWQPFAKHKNDDRVGKEIDEAVTLIEGFCQPVLAWTDITTNNFNN
jgi:hypothetical protein